MKTKERPKLSKEQIRRNIFLTTIVIGLIEVLLVTLIFVKQAYYLFWTPVIFIIVYAFALFMDLGKLKDLEEEESSNRDENPIEEEALAIEEEALEETEETQEKQ